MDKNQWKICKLMHKQSIAVTPILGQGGACAILGRHWHVTPL